MQCACAVLYCHLWPALTLHFPTLSHKGHDFRKQVIEPKMCVLILSTILCETFLILLQLREKLLKSCVGGHVKWSLFLSHFNESWNFPIFVWKILKCQIAWKSVRWEPNCSMRTDGQSQGPTDITKVNRRFSQFSKCSYKRKTDFPLSSNCLLSLLIVQPAWIGINLCSVHFCVPRCMVQTTLTAW
jgi:hypothetical protein